MGASQSKVRSPVPVSLSALTLRVKSASAPPSLLDSAADSFLAAHCEVGAHCVCENKLALAHAFRTFCAAHGPGPEVDVDIDGCLMCVLRAAAKHSEVRLLGSPGNIRMGAASGLRLLSFPSAPSSPPPAPHAGQ